MFGKLKIAILLIIIGVLGRFFFINHIGIPNFEIITALTLVSAVFLGRAWGIIVPLSIIAITDVFIGNSPVLIFTWSAFAIIGIFGWLSRFAILKDSSLLSLRGAERRSNLSRTGDSNLKQVERLPRSLWSLAMTITGMAGLGIGSSVFFFLYTNFGWWLVSGMYPHTLDGLIQCYIMGLPFFKNNLIGNLIFVPMFSGMVLILTIKKAQFLNNLNLKKQMHGN
jgi:hypothetical protein